jgi:serine/threonine protein kinase
VLVAVDMTKRTPPDPRHDGTDFSCVVADYGCSVGVLGTGFWRAPEILVAVLDQTLRPATFTQQADVYSFAMTSYEILTGWMPFEELGPEGYNVVVTGR